MNETTVTDQEILASVEKITLFLDSKEGNHAQDGILLLAAQHPSLELRQGEFDLLVVTRKDGSEMEDDMFSVGWIGGGQVKGLWALSPRGEIIDPWLDERVRKGANRDRMEPLPVVYRHPDHDGPLDVVYQAGEKVNFTAASDLLQEYRQWLESDQASAAQPSRVRVLLGPKGIEPMVTHSRWAQAVKHVDQRGVPPTRSRRSQDERKERERPVAVPSDEKSEAKAAIAKERQEIVMDAVVDINKRRPLSIVKAIICAAAGAGAGYGFIHLFG